MPNPAAIFSVSSLSPETIRALFGTTKESKIAKAENEASLMIDEVQDAIFYLAEHDGTDLFEQTKKDLKSKVFSDFEAEFQNLPGRAKRSAGHYEEGKSNFTSWDQVIYNFALDKRRRNFGRKSAAILAAHIAVFSPENFEPYRSGPKRFANLDALIQSQSRKNSEPACRKALKDFLQSHIDRLNHEVPE